MTCLLLDDHLLRDYLAGDSSDSILSELGRNDVATTDYSERHSSGSEVAVVIEVAGSSLARDRSTKQRICASAAVKNFDFVILGENLVEPYSEPIPGDNARYERCESLTVGQLKLGPV